jgi:glucose/arabinose dehydrogenase
VVNGLCPVPQTTTMFEVEAGAGGAPDKVDVLVPGSSYGWPTPRSTDVQPVAKLPAADRAPGGCAVLAGHIWVTSLDGTALLSAPLIGAGTGLSTGSLTAVITKKYGRLETVVAADDGALWLTTSNRDGHGSPVAADERVIRYVPSGGGANSPV